MPRPQVDTALIPERSGTYAMQRPSSTVDGHGLQEVKDVTVPPVKEHWQMDAYSFTESVGELGYVVNLKANTMAECKLRPEVRKPGTDEWEETDDPRVLRVMAAFKPIGGDCGELLKQATLHWEIAGEAFLIGQPVSDEFGSPVGFDWEFLSTLECRIEADGKIIRNAWGGSKGRNEIEIDAYIARLLHRDPRFSERADSPVRRILPILRELVLLTQAVDAVVKCADESTEIFTRQGWRTHDHLSPGDEVLTLDHGTGLTSWHPVLHVNRYDAVDREMVSIEANNHSSLTTTNHRWPVLHRAHGGIPVAGAVRTWRRSDELNTLDQIIAAAPCVDLPVEPKYSDETVELVAWLWTEGYVRNGQIDITQSYKVNAPKVARIRAALTRLYGNPVAEMRTGRGDGTPRWRESTRADRQCSVFHLNQAASAHLLQVCPAKYVDLVFIQSLTRAQLQLFLDVSLDADGSRRSNGGWTISQKDNIALDAIEMVCILLGLSTCRRQIEIQVNGVPYPVFRLSLQQVAARSIAQSRSKPVRTTYTGTVWCPTVAANETWLARRNGTSYWTGNSRLSAGIFFAPWEVSPASQSTPNEWEDPGNPDSGFDDFEEELDVHLNAPIEDRTAASSLHPLLMRGPAKIGDSPTKDLMGLVDLSRPLDGLYKELRQEALSRMAAGLDIPPEIMSGKSGLSGLGGGNVARSVDEDFILKHVVPVGRHLAGFVSSNYLRPMLVTFEGMEKNEADWFRVALDTSPIQADADRSGNATTGVQLEIISDEAWVRLNGLEDKDLAPLELRKRRTLERLLYAQPTLGPAILPILYPNDPEITASLEKWEVGQSAPGGAQAAPGGGLPAVPDAVGTAASRFADSRAAGLSDLSDTVVNGILGASDAYLVRALEKAANRLISRFNGIDKNQADRWRAVPRRQDVLSVAGVEAARRAGLGAEELFHGCWDELQIQVIDWLRSALQAVGAEHYAAGLAATAAASELAGQLTLLAGSSLNKPLTVGPNGYRIPSLVVTSALTVGDLAARD